jgi:hypothetical protein
VGAFFGAFEAQRDAAEVCRGHLTQFSRNFTARTNWQRFGYTAPLKVAASALGTAC